MLITVSLNYYGSGGFFVYGIGWITGLIAGRSQKFKLRSDGNKAVYLKIYG